ncbi:MAG: hypothetical protein A3J55_04510 [Candidatus Ryanbacteria bacterium RIFCSPHIGHO2_02_FULL_45_17b]|uniref:Uncharacterized protein n=1 Tax=Candidatus Ryanbacteria bacterium RIFCSPHIGHO2_01_FULL_45_22 TaxID=1802114 RepID=A0A1G2G2D8_9BACT|nr:MAG: hypothetical protein A2719_05085 [Candidatus Ryanbacteria bacterium RIFCSPHIGHO2_01_FULL_45_22]OGZ47606.1 MAG: hypothetical protein A3J55_04510 [Candidatus Ryanbacteria bacterium RIFCSPHIGHO2_02_FULL_45_17b]
MSPFTIENVIVVLTASMNRIIVFLVLVATVVFLWGIVSYISAGGDETKTESARHLIVYGILGFVVMIAMWGFVAIIIDFIFNTQTIPSIPSGSIVNPI